MTRIEPGCCQTLHAGGEPGGVADWHVIDVQIVLANSPHHHLTRIDTDANLHVDAVLLAQLLGITVTCLLHVQRRVQGTLGVIFMGNGRTKQRQNAVAHGLGDVALVAVHGVHHEL